MCPPALPRQMSFVTPLRMSTGRGSSSRSTSTPRPRATTRSSQLLIAHGPVVQVVDTETGTLAGQVTGLRFAHSIALDDTGSGTVSFSSLFDVHADIIKIDIDVTHGIDTDPMKEAMASALKSLADRLGAMSLAEGIETEQELELLREDGVQAGQGYLFGRPESVSD